jgi:hypothetical protein
MAIPSRILSFPPLIYSVLLVSSCSELLFYSLTMDSLFHKSSFAYVYASSDINLSLVPRSCPVHMYCIIKIIIVQQLKYSRSVVTQLLVVRSDRMHCDTLYVAYYRILGNFHQEKNCRFHTCSHW